MGIRDTPTGIRDMRGDIRDTDTAGTVVDIVATTVVDIVATTGTDITGADMFATTTGIPSTEVGERTGTGS
jgi:hypothetical protein